MEFNNSVIYIDEINSFIENLVSNETIKNLKTIYHLLIKIIKTAYKVIVSDAVISDMVVEFLKYRDDRTKILFINEYKNIVNTPAI